MKVILVTLLLVGAAFAAVVQQNTFGAGPACPIDDPLTVEEGNINVTVTKPILELFVGSYQNGGVANGLSSLYYEYTINLITMGFTVTAGLSADIKGDKYNAEGMVDATPFSDAVVPSGPLSGSGSYYGAIKDGYVAASGTILVNLISNRISLSKLEISEISFTSLEANAGDLTIGDKKIDWVDWNANIKENFDAEWATKGGDFTEIVRKEVVNTYLGQFTLAEFLEMIGETGTPAPCKTPASQF
jgi:hypothetical protein